MRASQSDPAASPGDDHSPAGDVGRIVFLRILFCGLFPLFTVYLIFSHSVPFGLSRSAPTAALAFHADYLPAVAALADRAINRAKAKSTGQKPAEGKDEEAETEPDVMSLPEIKNALRNGARNSPLNAQVFRELGQIYSLEGDPTRAQNFMETAVKLSRHEPAAVSFLMLEAFKKEKVKTALYYADILMRSSQAGLDYAAPIVVRLMDYPPARDEIAKLLSTSPPWRPMVLGRLPDAGLIDPQSPQEVFRFLKKTAHPPTQSEIGFYLNFLVRRNLPAAAYSVWLEFLPPDQMETVAYLFNGSFERDPSDSLFDWNIGQGAETRVIIASRDDKEKERALYIRFGQGRSTFPTVRQLIVLSPGQYRLKGLYMGDMRSRRGLQWRVSCYRGSVAGAGEAMNGDTPEWRPFSFDFSIPPEKCPAQFLELVHMARSPSEQIATGSMWFDELSITRVLADRAAGP